VGVPEVVEVPIFPLPDVVFFPRTLLPLHIFEPRYRRMVHDAMNGRKQIGMVLLRPGWETDSVETPEFFSIGSMGHISECQTLDSGDYEILLSGINRFEILKVSDEDPYRVARVKVLKERYLLNPEENLLMGSLIKLFKDLSVTREGTSAELEFLETADFETLVNSICTALPFSYLQKQMLLEQDCLKERADAVLELMNRLLVQKELVTEFAHLRPDDATAN
jgi:Lon protease-like protein